MAATPLCASTGTRDPPPQPLAHATTSPLLVKATQCTDLVAIAVNRTPGST